MGFKLDDKIQQYLLLAKRPAQTMLKCKMMYCQQRRYDIMIKISNSSHSTHVSYSRIVTEDTTSKITIDQMLLRQKMVNRIIAFYHPVSPHSSSVTTQYNGNEINHPYIILPSLRNSEWGLNQTIKYYNTCYWRNVRLRRCSM